MPLVSGENPVPVSNVSATIQDGGSDPGISGGTPRITIENTPFSPLMPPPPPYNSVPVIRNVYSGPCPTGEIQYPGTRLGNEYRNFSYVPSPTADIAALTAGMVKEDQDRVLKICEEENVIILFRSTSEFAEALLRSGAADPKPEFIKTKTITKDDLLLNTKLLGKDLGKVGYFDPVLPVEAPYLSEKEKDQLVAWYLQRKKEFSDQAEVIKRHKNAPLNSGQRIMVRDSGVVQKILPDKKIRDITGDYDVFGVLDATTGETLTDMERMKKVYSRLRKELNIQHLWHSQWDYRNKPSGEYYVDKEIDEKIINSHSLGKTGAIELIRFSPGLSISGVFIGSVSENPGFNPAYSQGPGIKLGSLSLPSAPYLQPLNEIPMLKDPGYASGSLCRGACGINCDNNRCEAKPNYTLEIEGGTCIYSKVIDCKTNQECCYHDACYDWCAELGESFTLDSVLGSCHAECNQRCYDDNGRWNCYKWTGITGFEDILFTVPYSGLLRFSDPPVFVEGPAKKVDNSINASNLIDFTYYVYPYDESFYPGAYGLDIKLTDSSVNATDDVYNIATFDPKGTCFKMEEIYPYDDFGAINPDFQTLTSGKRHLVSLIYEPGQYSVKVYKTSWRDKEVPTINQMWSDPNPDGRGEEYPVRFNQKPKAISGLKTFVLDVKNKLTIEG
jgi:hypothetical protein